MEMHMASVESKSDRMLSRSALKCEWNCRKLSRNSLYVTLCVSASGSAPFWLPPPLDFDFDVDVDVDFDLDSAAAVYPALEAALFRLLPPPPTLRRNTPRNDLDDAGDPAALEPSPDCVDALDGDASDCAVAAVTATGAAVDAAAVAAAALTAGDSGCEGVCVGRRGGTRGTEQKGRGRQRRRIHG